MQEIASYKRRVFLKDHPVVTQRIVLSSAGTAQTLLAGTVIAAKTVTATSATTVGAYAKPGDGETAALLGVLAEDVAIPAAGDAYALVYVHAAVIASELIWDDGVSAADQQAALTELRKVGVLADIDYFDSRVLTGVINRRPVKYDIFGNMFRRQAPKATELFELHVVSRGVSMLPSITNAAGGTMRSGREGAAFAVKAPRFRPKRLFKAADLLKHAGGQTPYDLNVNPVERAIAEDMDDHRADIDTMVEIMCAQAIVHGKIDLFDAVEGKVVKTFTVDFRRPEAHTVVLEGAAQWTGASSDLQDSLQTYDEMIQEEANLGATDLYLGRKAWAAFRKHPDVRDDLDRNNINIGQLSPSIQSKFKGIWNGLRIWLVTGTYKDIEGKVQYYLAPEYALLAASDAENVMEFGQPMDVDCSGPVEIFSKQFKQDDPSGIFTIAESRPLPWPKQPGATVLIKAVA